VVGGILLGVVGLALLIARRVALPVFNFPTPGGPYAIGTLTYHWVDAARDEIFTHAPGDVRELIVQVWYPAQQMPDAPRAPYIADADRVTPELSRLAGLPAFLLTHLRDVTTHAVESTPIADSALPFPVLIFLSGLNGFRQVNTFQIQELVSHGFIVVGLDQPGASALVRFPDGRQISGQPRAIMHPLIQQSVAARPTTPSLFDVAMPEGIVPYFAADVPFVLDQLTLLNATDPTLGGRLDMGHVGIIGVSLGGINAAEACLNDMRLKACLMMDVFMSANVVREGLRQPALWITRDAETMRLERERAGGWTEEDIALHQTTMRAVYETLHGDGYYLQIPNMFHLNLTDFPYWSPLTAPLGMTGPIDAQRVFDIINAYSLAFFDRHLRGLPAPLLEEGVSPYPEAQFERR
jgi:predicted dienelactone hydrolase